MVLAACLLMVRRGCFVVVFAVPLASGSMVLYGFEAGVGFEEVCRDERYLARDFRVWRWEGGGVVVVELLFLLFVVLHVSAGLNVSFRFGVAPTVHVSLFVSHPLVCLSFFLSGVIQSFF